MMDDYAKARTPEQVKQYIQETSKLGGATLSDGAKGATIGALNKALGGGDNRKIVFGWLFDANNAVSGNTLTESQWYAIHSWVGMWKDDVNPAWRPSARFSAEAAFVLTEALKWYANRKDAWKDHPEQLILTGVAALGGTITSIADEGGNWSRTEAVEVYTPSADDSRREDGAWKPPEKPIKKPKPKILF